MPFCRFLTFPMRAQPSHTAEMVNQVLFGESFSVEDHHKDWQLIKLGHDGYEGWTDMLEPTEIDKLFMPDNIFVQTGFDGAISYNEGQNWLPLSPGSMLPNLNAGSMPWGKTNLMHRGTAFSIENLKKTGLQKDLTLLIKPWLDIPYLWGGRSWYGLDCSGLIQLVFRLLGYTLPRDASQQASCGRPVHFVQEVLPGDLGFFSATSNSQKITHVGIFLGSEKMAHASGKVRISNIDQTGLFENGDKKYTHFLRLIKRILPEAQ